MPVDELAHKGGAKLDQIQLSLGHASLRGCHRIRKFRIFDTHNHAGLRASELGSLELRDYSAATERLMIHRLKGSNSDGLLVSLLCLERDPSRLTTRYACFMV